MSEFVEETRTLKNGHARKTVSVLVVICGITVTAASVGAVLWLSAFDIGVRSALPKIVPTMLVAGIAMTFIGTLVSWMLFPRWFQNVLANILISEGEAYPARRIPSWRAFVKDPLTGLFTHDALLAFADDAIPYFRRYKRGVSILMVEIDQFRAIKAGYGLDGAERVIRHIAEVLDFSVRKTDKVARLEENRFIILLREIKDSDTVSLAHRIRDAVADLAVRHADVVIPVTVSVGAAIVAENDMISETLIERAQTALGAAKTEGGNRVSFGAITPALVDAA